MAGREDLTGVLEQGGHILGFHGNTCYVQSKLTGGDTDDQLQALGWRVLGPKGSKSKHRVGFLAPRKTKR